MKETLVLPLTQRFGVRDPITKRIAWLDFQNPDGTPPATLPRPPGVTDYQENYGPLDPAAQYVTKRKFPQAPADVWTSPPKSAADTSGAAPKMEWTQSCTLAELEWLPGYYRLDP